MTHSTRASTSPIEIKVENHCYNNLLALIRSSLKQPNPNLPHYESGYFLLSGKRLFIACSKKEGKQEWYAEYGKKQTPEEALDNACYDYSSPITFYKSAKSFRGIFNFIKERYEFEQMWEEYETQWKEMRTA